MSLRRIAWVWAFLTWIGTDVVPVAWADSSVTIAVFDGGSRTEHEKRVIRSIRRALSNCSRCKIESYPIYETNGELRIDRVLQAIKKGAIRAQVLHFSWNMEASEQTRPIEKALAERISEGKIVVAAAGENSGKDDSDRHRILPLAKTVMGRVSGALIIGEKNEKGFLAPRSNYGPEMLTAVSVPPGERGSSFSSAVFTGHLARALSKAKTSSDLIRTIRERKSRSVNMLPDWRELLQ